MPATTPDSLIATSLATGGYGTVDTDIFVGEEIPVSTGVPGAAVFVECYGGPAPTPYLGGASAADYWVKYVQVLVRTPASTKATGRTKARDINAHLQKLALTGYVQCIVLQSEPIRLGLGDDEHYRWTVNVRTELKE